MQERIDRRQPWRPGNLEPAYVLYFRGERRGRRRDSAQLLRLLKQVLGIE